MIGSLRVFFGAWWRALACNLRWVYAPVRSARTLFRARSAMVGALRMFREVGDVPEIARVQTEMGWTALATGDAVRLTDPDGLSFTAGDDGDKLGERHPLRILLALGTLSLVAAAVVFRIATFYIPAGEGFFAMRWLERAGHL